MRTKLFALLIVVSVLLSACAAPATPTTAVQAPPVKETVLVPQTQVVQQTMVVEQTKVVEKVV